MQLTCELGRAFVQFRQFIGYYFARAGRKDEARKALADLEDMSKHRFVPAYWLAAVHIGLGENNEDFYVSLTGVTGALISNSTGYGTIQDDEPRLSINSVSVQEGNTHALGHAFKSSTISSTVTTIWRAARAASF